MYDDTGSIGTFCICFNLPAWISLTRDQLQIFTTVGVKLVTSL